MEPFPFKEKGGQIGNMELKKASTLYGAKIDFVAEAYVKQGSLRDITNTNLYLKKLPEPVRINVGKQILQKLFSTTL